MTPPLELFRKFIVVVGKGFPKVNCAMRTEMGTNVESPTSVDGVSSCEKKASEMHEAPDICHR